MNLSSTGRRHLYSDLTLDLQRDRMGHFQAIRQHDVLRRSVSGLIVQIETLDMTMISKENFEDLLDGIVELAYSGDKTSLQTSDRGGEEAWTKYREVVDDQRVVLNGGPGITTLN